VPVTSGELIPGAAGVIAGPKGDKGERGQPGPAGQILQSAGGDELQFKGDKGKRV